MLTDHRMDIGVKARAQLSIFIEPFWWLAALPSRMWSGVDDELATRQALQESNEKLIHELQIVNARMQRMRAINDENQRLRDLLNASRSGSMQVQMVSILDVDLNPYRQRIVLNAGRFCREVFQPEFFMVVDGTRAFPFDCPHTLVFTREPKTGRDLHSYA